ncbi:MAG: hypothetical protein RBT73_08735, partial [Spirochaetia bacterium]|nr:hypothetical protein [Spirochaetia bacterium]
RRDRFFVLFGVIFSYQVEELSLIQNLFYVREFYKKNYSENDQADKKNEAAGISAGALFSLFFGSHN